MALADILNKAELDALYADNVAGDISPSDLRNLVASIAPHGGAMPIPANATWGITATATKIPLSAAFSPATDLITYDDTNDQFVVKGSGIYLVSLRLKGTWGSNDDVNIEYYVNGTGTGQSIESAGTGRIKTMSVTQLAVLVNNADIAESIISNAGEAWIDMRIKDADGSSFNINLVAGQMEIDYVQMTINAVG